jgi:hypothetical protein
MSFGSVWKKAVALAEADAVKVKNALATAVQEIDGVVLPAVETYQPLLEQVANQIAPGGAKFVDASYAVSEALAKLLDSGNAAVKQHLLDAGLDTSLIAQIESLVPDLKAAAKV